MNRTVAQMAQNLGKLTVVVALLLLVWTVADIAGSNDAALTIGPQPNQYVAVLAQSTGLAVSGMLAIALGMMLEKLSADD